MAYKLLLADDSITIQKVVELTLSEEDFVVTAVGDGVTALETARKLMPDIILADVFMPKMDGYELCGKLKQDPALKGVPVILLAGTFENFDDARAAQAGAADHLTKPFESSDLISKTKKLVEMSMAAPTEAALAEPVDEAVFAEEVFEAAPADTDDLWSVVDMASDSQPLAGATASMSEEDLWKRANLVSDSDETAVFPQDEGVLPWEDLSAEPVAAEEVEDEPLSAMDMDAAQVEEDLPVAALEERAADATAILNMEDLGVSSYNKWGGDEPLAVEPSEVSAPGQILPFESIEEATATSGFHQAAPAVEPAVLPAAPAAVSVDMEMIREEVLKAVRETLDKRIKEALAGISRDVIERVVWEVVPDLAEEILAREIERLKAGIT